MKINTLLSRSVMLFSLIAVCMLFVQPAYSQKFKKFKNKYPEFAWWKITYPNGNVGFSVNEKKNILVDDARGYSSVGYFGEGLFLVEKGGCEGLVNMQGVEVVSPDKYNDIKSKYNISSGYKYLQVSVGESRFRPGGRGIRVFSPESIGVLNYSGKVLLPCKYKFINFLSSEHISVNNSGKSHLYFVASNNECCVVCDTAGTVLFSTTEYKYVFPRFTATPVESGVANNIIAYSVGVSDKSGKRKYGVCSKDGELLLPPRYDSCDISDLHGEMLVVFRENAKCGVADISGNEIVPPVYDNVYLYRDKDLKYFKVELNKKTGICDENGVEIIPLLYDGIAYYNGEFRDFVTGRFCEVIDVARYANPEEKITQENSKWVLSYKGKIFSLHPYDELVWVKDKNRYYGTIDGYSTYIDLTGKEVNSIAKRVFDEAYAMPSTNFQEKFTLYNRVIELDSNNREGYKALALNNIGVMYAEGGDENTALAYYDKSAKLGNSYGISNAKSIRDARAAAERAERSQRISNALTQISNSLSTMSSTLQQNSINNYNHNNGGNSGGSGGSSNVRRTSHCTKCAGSGDCSKCGGDGYVLGKFDQEFHPCSSCNFNDRTPKNKKGKCTFCNGTGVR